MVAMAVSPIPSLAVLMVCALGAPGAWAGELAARCSNATLKGTYLFHHSGILEGQPYAESGRAVYDGKGGLVVAYQDSAGSGGTEKATYTVSADCIGKVTYDNGQIETSFISPDGSRFTYTMTVPPGRKPTALSGIEVRVAP